VSRPVVAVTMGDPAGIGPEVALRAISSAALRRDLEPLLVGDLGVFLATAERLKLKLEFVVRGAPAEARRATRAAGGGDRSCATPTAGRRPTPAAATRSPRHPRRRRLTEAPLPPRWSRRRSRRTCTPPVTTCRAHRVARRAGARPPRAHDDGGARSARRVATTHVAIASSVVATVVRDTILAADDALCRSWRAPPRLAVCGLNPHAGEADPRRGRAGH
jgi:4-hydroxythreonine-4-phosphate dehydrogenase